MPLTEESKKKILEKWKTAYELAQNKSSLDAMHYHHTKQNMDIYDNKGDANTIIRGDVIVEGMDDAKQLLDYFSTDDLEKTNHVQKGSIRSNTLEEWKDESGDLWKIRYTCYTAGVPFVADRDLLCVEKFFTKENVLNHVSTSVDDLYETPKDFSFQKGAVRSTNIFAWRKFEKLSEKTFHVSFTNQASANGWIPASVVNSAVYSSPLAVVKIAELLGFKVRTPSNSPSLKK
ncbi:predicted protein [Naegleria gruberi]|uniref:Predicted protein n=1 Tax=Naegleria gruberi TaxID=5762 RepID=D2VZ71_NAEGR|nr:uncharacterized protein NAEGRDRAFT_74381 [Naegleria gruberi]EFC37941.1 predicted protein [Naegleria gruberi]|eukprot:XP_002670685.1 predicted protein [Naegleria gruberi strain NEG-M]